MFLDRNWSFQEGVVENLIAEALVDHGGAPALRMAGFQTRSLGKQVALVGARFRILVEEIRRQRLGRTSRAIREFGRAGLQQTSGENMCIVDEGYGWDGNLRRLQ